MEHGVENVRLAGMADEMSELRVLKYEVLAILTAETKAGRGRLRLAYGSLLILYHAKLMVRIEGEGAVCSSALWVALQARTRAEMGEKVWDSMGDGDWQVGR